MLRTGKTSVQMLLMKPCSQWIASTLNGKAPLHHSFIDTPQLAHYGFTTVTPQYDTLAKPCHAQTHNLPLLTTFALKPFLAAKNSMLNISLAHTHTHLCEFAACFSQETFYLLHSCCRHPCPAVQFPKADVAIVERQTAYFSHKRKMGVATAMYAHFLCLFSG